MVKGDALMLLDGKGTVYSAEVVYDRLPVCKLRITSKHFIERSKDAYVHIAIAVLRQPDRLEWFVEKATEIGADEISLLLCERCEKQHISMRRIEKILISALKQSGRPWLPVFNAPKTFKDFIEQEHEKNKYIAHCMYEEKEELLLISRTTQGASLIVIGPEGDFSRNEIQMALSRHFIPVSIGPTRLRSETAGVVACALLCVAGKNK